MGNGAMADDYAAGYNDNGKYIPAGIVLGEYSYSNTRAGKVGYLNDKKGSKPSSAFTDEYWNAVWTATANPMAIGNADTDASGKGEGHNGHGVLTRQITGVAAGTDLTDAVNVAQLQAAIAQFSGGGSGISGDGVHYYSVSSNEQGPDSNYDNKGATGANALAAGVSASATGAHSVAVGNGATAKGQDSIALGTGAVADGIGATAIGQYNTASGQNSLAFGEKSTASGEASTAFGIGSTAAAKNSLAALGGTVAESAENAAAIGKNAQATLADSVALGSNSVTTRAKYSDLTDEEKKAVYIKGDSTGSAWEATDNAIAVGNDSKVTRQITGVAAGSLDTDAVNVAQLKKVQNLAGKHTKVTVEGGTAAGTADYAGENLKLKVKDDNGQKTYDLKLSDKLSVGGKDGQDGHIGVNGQDGKSGVGIDGKDGISIKGKDGKDGVTIKGIDGKDGVNGAEGHIGLNGKDGMTDIWTKPGTPGLNGKDGETMTRIVYKDPSGQEHEAATLDDGLKFGGDFGNASAVKLDKQVNVKGNAKKETDLTDGNIGVVSSQDGENGQLLIKLNKDLNLGNNGSVKMGNTTINNAGVTIQPSAGDATKSVSLTNKGLDNGGNKITNVAAGEISDTSTDAVNGSQLNTVKNLAEQHTTVEAGPSGNVTVTPGTNADGSKKYTVDLAKDVTFGDAAKGDNTVAISGTNGTITAGTGDNKITVDGSRGQIVAGGNNGVKIGNIENGDRSLTIYDKDGKATDKKADGGQFVTNLDNKTWNTDGSYVSGRAATEDQLHQVESNVNKKFDDVNTKIESVDKHHTEVTVNGGTAAKADGSYTDGNLQIAQKTGSDGQKIYDLKLSDNLNIGGVGKDGKDGKDGHMGINGADGKSGVGIDGKDGISIKGKDGQNGVTIKGVDGKDGTEGHIGLTGPKGADGQNATADIHVQNGQNGVDGTDGHGGKDGMDRVVYEDHNHITHEVATMDDGMKYSGDSGNAAVKLNKNVQIYGGATEYADGNNIGVVASQDGDNAKLQVKLAKDLKGLDSVTTGDTTINNSGLTVKGDDNHKDITIHQDNVNMGGNKVSGVADGKVSKDSTDAVNGSQLWQRDQAINGLSGSVNKLGNRINRVGAGAAALAALHPLDFDPDDKWDFAAGYGNYRGANAAAIGAYYRPNEDTMFSVGGSFGGGENMVNAGVSIKLGQGNHVSTSRVAMAKEMKAMRQHMAEQDALIAKLQSMHGMAVDPTKSTLFPDVAENHWAYQYVTTLAKKGILEGYPDGEFKGDRMMTRYEFAAIVYRIVESGVGSTDPELSKLVKEFSPELQYIRIDTIQKDRNGKPTIERVRVISDAK
ncbi:S-layer domain protein [Megasphaera sp. NM10]|nr:S-layer domain protein [Megasphaera sp. NM10]